MPRLKAWVSLVAIPTTGCGRATQVITASTALMSARKGNRPTLVPTAYAYEPDFRSTLAKDGVKEGDFVMAMGYPGRTNRHRLPSE